MSEPNTSILFEAIRAAFKDDATASEVKQLVVEESVEDMLALAVKHDVAHLMVHGLETQTSDNFLSEKAKQFPLIAAFRYQKSDYELVCMCELFEKNHIPHLPLKGSVLRKYYPEPWMRTSCDIDILVRKEDLSRATECLVDQLGYEVRSQFSHDISLFSRSNVHVELHFDLIENTVSERANEILERVWELSHLKEGCQYRFEMSDELLYFYHVAHMAKHFENGGCGIRPFIDLWVLDGIDGANFIKRDEFLEQGGLLNFANSARALSRVWFEGAPIDALSQQMEHYILRGGVYGNNENRITVQQQKKGGRSKYALSKIFIPYDEIKFHYPILQKHRWLTPFMEIRRWGKLIFCGHLKRVSKELKYNKNISDIDAADTRDFLNNIGL